MTVFPYQSRNIHLPLAAYLPLTILVSSHHQCCFRYVCYPVALVRFCWFANANFCFTFIPIPIQLPVTNSAVAASIACIGWLFHTRMSFSQLVTTCSFAINSVYWMWQLPFFHPKHLFNFIKMYDTIAIPPFPHSSIHPFFALQTLISLLCIMFLLHQTLFQMGYLANHPSPFLIH